MEYSGMKTPVIMEEKRSGVAGRIVGLLAGGVVMLAVAFIVLIACGTYVVTQQQNQCQKTSMPYQEISEEFDHETRMNGTLITEHTIAYMESRREFSVTRDSKTGYVTSVLFLDYKKGITVLYAANKHSCYLYNGTEGDFNNDLTRLRNPEYDSDEAVTYTIDDHVDDSSDLPVEMAPFCTTFNSVWLLESYHRPDNRQKRYYNCYYMTCTRLRCYYFCLSDSSSSESTHF